MLVLGTALQGRVRRRCLANTLASGVAPTEWISTPCRAALAFALIYVQMDFKTGQRVKMGNQTILKNIYFPYSLSRQSFISDAWIKQLKCPSKFVGCWYLFLINPEKLGKFQGTGSEPERIEKLTQVIKGL